jgi:outer membrane protein assembly factor BamB
MTAVKSLALAVSLVLLGDGASADNWPSFRGAAAGGVGHGRTPTTWDIARSVNVAWKTPIQGLAISSPIVWGDRVYVTTAVPLARPQGRDFRTRHVWKLLSVDRVSGKVIWELTAHEGVPYMQRHEYSSYANATPATDGQHIVALFGTEALACYDTSGKLLWKKLLDVNSKRDAFNSGSSPIIVNDMAIVQDDRDRDSSIAAYRLRDGSEVWRVKRDDGPSQGTPVVWNDGKNGATLLIVVAERSIRAIDARTGKPVWSFLAKIAYGAASPAISGDLVISSAGEDVHALRASSSGTASEAWSVAGGGAAIPSPLILGDNVYVLNDNGIVTTFNIQTGRKVFQQRTSAGEFCASPVSADGKIYVFSRDGDATVLRAATLEVIARNKMGAAIQATPAIADGTLYVRTAAHLIALHER